MTRQLLLVVGAALLSAAGFASLLALCWMVSHMLIGVVPYLLESRFHAMIGVLPVLFLGVAFVGASCMASALARRRKPPTARPQFSSRSHSRLRP